MEREPEHIEWCNYCHSEIFDTEDYIVKKHKFYHHFCWKQLHTYLDDGLAFLQNDNNE